jgi:glycosyltransferase involved in cell wall biosynthesis
MRILLVTARYLPHRGGLESVVQNLAQEFSNRGHQVLIVTNRYPRSLPSVEVIDGIKVMRLHFLLPNVNYLKEFRIDLWLAGLWYRFFTYLELCAIIQDFQPNVINSHYLNVSAEFTGRCISNYFSSIPWIISLHGGDVDGEPLLGLVNKNRFHRFARQAQCLTACSEFLSTQAKVLDPSLEYKIRVIHNGVDLRRFSSVRPVRSANPYILGVGQLIPHKGFDLLIRAFASLAEKYPSVELWIAGEGSQRPHLESLILQKGLDHRVQLLGRVDENAVASLMASSLFVAVPSLKEPFGIVALEAMASSRAVVASPVGGLPEFLPCPPNLLVSPILSDWVSALSERLDLSDTIPLKVESNLDSARTFDWSLVAERYLHIYEQA